MESMYRSGKGQAMDSSKQWCASKISKTNKQKKERKIKGKKGKEKKEKAWFVTGANFHSVDVPTMASEDRSPQCFTADPLSRIYPSCNASLVLNNFFPYQVWPQKAAPCWPGHGQVILIASPLPTEAVKHETIFFLTIHSETFWGSSSDRI